MKLPTFEAGFYEVDNAESTHLEYPDSFWIPEKKLRESLKSGDLVKLVFRMQTIKDSDDLSVERMWVKITKAGTDFYTGTLDNDPGGSVCLSYGQTVSFKPCHIIDIYDEQ